MVGGVACGYCLTPFTPRKAWQKFCSTACRTEDNARRAADGMRGRVASIRPMKGGRVSMVVHFAADAREQALKLEPGKTVGVLADG